MKSSTLRWVSLIASAFALAMLAALAVIFTLNWFGPEIALEYRDIIVMAAGGIGGIFGAAIYSRASGMVDKEIKERLLATDVFG